MTHWIDDYISGLVGGVAGIVVGQPADTVKIRLQTQPGVYSGALDCCRTILKREGVSGYFKGMMSPLIGVSLINGVVFGVQAQTLSFFKEENIKTHFYSGVAAGAVQSLITSPMELAKTQMQVQGINELKTSKQQLKYRNSWDAIRQILRTQGITGAYRGLVLTLFRDAPAFGIYFATYDVLTTTVLPVKEEGPNMSMKDFSCALIAGGFAGVSSWLFTYPIDVVKSCMQADGRHGKMTYSGPIDCCLKLYRADGITPFFRGLSPCLVRAFPVNAVTFVGVKICLALITDFREKKSL